MGEGGDREEGEQQEEGRSVEDEMKGKWEGRINTRLEKKGWDGGSTG